MNDEAVLTHLTDTERAAWFRAKKRPHTGMIRTLRTVADLRCKYDGAPDTLSALRDVLACVEASQPFGQLAPMQADAMLVTVRAAIAKATEGTA